MSSLWFPSSCPQARRSHPCPRQTCAQLNQLKKLLIHFAEGLCRYSLVSVIALAAMMAGFVPAAAAISPAPGQAQTQVEAASRLVARGSLALQQDDLNAARNLFQRALEINPKDVLAHTYLGFLADRTGDLKEAELHFAAATEIEPALASARNNYGGILLKRGRVREAEAQFEASLRLDSINRARWSTWPRFAFPVVVPTTCARLVLCSSEPTRLPRTWKLPGPWW